MKLLRTDIILKKRAFLAEVYEVYIGKLIFICSIFLRSIKENENVDQAQAFATPVSQNETITDVITQVRTVFIIATVVNRLLRLVHLAGISRLLTAFLAHVASQLSPSKSF